MVQLNSLNDFNSVTIVCVCNCDICEILREAKNKTKQNNSEAKIHFKDKKNFVPAFRRDQKPNNTQFISLGKDRNKEQYPLSITLRYQYIK